MQCVYLTEERCRKFADIENMERGIGQTIIKRSDHILSTISGGPVKDVYWSDMTKFRSIATANIYEMYGKVPVDLEPG